MPETYAEWLRRACKCLEGDCPIHTAEGLAEAQSLDRDASWTLRADAVLSLARVGADVSQERERPAAIIGRVPAPLWSQRPGRALRAGRHRLGFWLWRLPLDEGQRRLEDPAATGYIETLEETAETYLMRAERAERENAELSEMVGQWHEKWKQAYNRLRDYENRDGEAL